MTNKRRLFLTIGLFAAFFIAGFTGIRAWKTAHRPVQPTPEGTGVSVVLYVPDEQAETLMPLGAQAADDSDQALVDELIVAGALPKGCAVQKSELVAAEDAAATAGNVPLTLHLDMNDTFAKAVHASGTAGETMLVYALVDTMLQARGAESVLLTVDGNPLETGHEIYDYPLKMSYQNAA